MIVVWRDPPQRSFDLMRAEHEAGHPDTGCLICPWCADESGYPASIDDPIPLYDIGYRQRRAAT